MLGDPNDSQSPVCKGVMTSLEMVRETRWMVFFRWSSEEEVTVNIPDLGDEDQERREPGRGTVKVQCRDRACW